MDWLPIAGVAFAGFFCGLLLASRVLAWLAGLALILRSPATGTGERTAPWLAQFFLHSGPWSLALASGALYYLASLPQRMWLWAVLSGGGLAVAVLVIAMLAAHRRQRLGNAVPVPLTPERLLKIRRRFFWGTTIFFGGAMSAWMLYLMWPRSGQNIGLAIVTVIICTGSGYVFSWFMWQFYGAELQARESARQRAQRNNAV